VRKPRTPEEWANVDWEAVAERARPRQEEADRQDAPLLAELMVETEAEDHESDERPTEGEDG
jgi:hypothetical protein